jgi:hypothetical protein
MLGSMLCNGLYQPHLVCLFEFVKQSELAAHRIAITDMFYKTRYAGPTRALSSDNDMVLSR